MAKEVSGVGLRTKTLGSANLIKRTFDRTDDRTRAVIAPVVFHEDFSKYDAAFDTAPSIWTVVESTATAAVLTDVEGGVLSVLTTIAGSDQKAYAFFNGDDRFDVGATDTSKYAQAEFRFLINTVAEDLGGHELVLGLSKGTVTANLADANVWAPVVFAGLQVGNAESATPNLSLFIRTDSNVTDSTAKDTGVDLVVDTWYNFRIDFSDKASVKFYLNGVRLLPDTTFKFDDVVSGLMEALILNYKHTNQGDDGANALRVSDVWFWSE